MRFERDNIADSEVSKSVRVVQIYKKGVRVVQICMKGALRAMYSVGDSDPDSPLCRSTKLYITKQAGEQRVPRYSIMLM
jgi:hypothetical protein